MLESLHCLICTSTLSDSFEIDKSYQAMFLVLLKFCGKKIHYTHTTMTSKYFSLCSNICKNSVLNVYRLCSAAWCECSWFTLILGIWLSPLHYKRLQHCIEWVEIITDSRWGTAVEKEPWRQSKRKYQRGNSQVIGWKLFQLKKNTVFLALCSTKIKIFPSDFEHISVRNINTSYH